MLTSIQNYYEQVVFEVMYNLLDGREEAQDAEFMADLACVALNRLPARYIRHRVDLWSHISDDERIAMHQEVVTAVTAALATIRRRQRS